MKDEWESMTIDELFTLRELMQDVLSSKLKAKKAELERRLQILQVPSNGIEPTKSR
jgi:hypothetical protein